MTRIDELEQQIAQLPVGYISKKNIRGKVCYYRQWKEAGKVCSQYIKPEELSNVQEQIALRHSLSDELRLEQHRIRQKKRVLAYARRFYLGRHVPIGVQDYETLITRKLFYVDKTDFIREWWEQADEVTLITRPRRFGKTLNMSMLNCFFSTQYANRSDLFDGLSIWTYPKFRKLQGTYPVIFLSFGAVKSGDCEIQKEQIKACLNLTLRSFHYLLDQHLLSLDEEAQYHQFLTHTLTDADACQIVPFLSMVLYRIYQRKAIVLLDEYDTPMLEAWLSGNWDTFSTFMRALLNSFFKTNLFLERGLLTGITRIGKESFFSDFNHLCAVGATSPLYAASFGFTETEVFDAMDEQHLSEKAKVKEWYDGFHFGTHKDIYNPWSIINYLRSGEFRAYWVHSSSNKLISDLFRPAGSEMKHILEDLMNGNHLFTPMEEDVAFSDLNRHPKAVWSLLVASGYLKVVSRDSDGIYELAVTNKEVSLMLVDLVQEWFAVAPGYHSFIEALLTDDLYYMNITMQSIMESVFSYFDTSGGANPLGAESFYHGFVLGLIVHLDQRYIITSNRESGLGRYDVMMEPRDPANSHAIILEFKIRRPDREADLDAAADAALAQIDKKKYAADLIARGIEKNNIYCYGFAFDGKQVLIKGGSAPMTIPPSR